MSALAEWPALVLSAGLGMRLRPLSSVRAKPAMPVGGEPLVRHILRGLAAAGVQHAVLNLHHLPATLTAVVGDGSDLGLSVRYSWEPILLGSAGGPRRARAILDADRFLIVNGDTLTDVDLPGLAAEHQRSGALVTMGVVHGKVARYGGVRVCRDGAVAGFAAAGSQGPVALGSDTPDAVERILHFIGAQAVEARAFDSVPDDAPSETVRWLYPALLAAEPGCVRASVSAASFLDIGTPADYFAAAHLSSHSSRSPHAGTGTRVDPTAEVEHTVLWDRVTVGPGARLRHCIVADDVQVPAGAEFERKILTAGPDSLAVTSF